MGFKKIILLLGIICSIFIQPAFADEDDDTGQTEEVPVGAMTQDIIGNMLLQSVSLIGIPYKWGGNTPQQGMDCSGFIRYVFRKSLGITLPRTAAEMAKVGKRVSIDELEPGDLIFFTFHHSYIDHVGMYIGNNKFIQSPRTGENIQVTELTSVWRAKINGAKRIVQEDEDTNGHTTVQSYQEINDEALPVRYGYTRRAVRKTGKSSGSKSNSKSNKSSNRNLTSGSSSRKRTTATVTHTKSYTSVKKTSTVKKKRY
ncbi:MAG: hypothetical protein QG673_122 [Pseudomonadota bacterium]|nr:hypothetical protein [Pseudomonadota bacterium]